MVGVSFGACRRCTLRSRAQLRPRPGLEEPLLRRVAKESSRMWRGMVETSRSASNQPVRPACPSSAQRRRRTRTDRRVRGGTASRRPSRAASTGQDPYPASRSGRPPLVRTSRTRAGRSGLVLLAVGVRENRRIRNLRRDVAGEVERVIETILVTRGNRLLAGIRVDPDIKPMSGLIQPASQTRRKLTTPLAVRETTTDATSGAPLAGDSRSMSEYV